MDTGKVIFQKVIAMAVVFVMMMTEFALVGEGANSYAVDAVKTNNKSVEITAYIQDENGEQLNNITSTIDKTNLKLIAEVTVINDKGKGGYFEGNISLENANFRFKEEGNTSLYVNSGETKKIEKEIVYMENNDISSTYLNQQTQVKLTGKFVNSKKEYNIEGAAGVTVNWVSKEDSEAQLEAKILTNASYIKNEVNEANETIQTSNQIVQMLIASKLKDNSYPVKNTEIKTIVPEGVEEITVHKRKTDATNGNREFNENNYQYNSENRELVINIQNNEENGKIGWIKNALDTLVVTYKYSQDATIDNSDIEINSKITLYDNKELTATTTTKVEDEVDGMITNSIAEQENNIYKGKIYTGEDRYYTSTTQLNVDYVDAIESMNVSEKEAEFVSKDNKIDANIQYVRTVISKSEFDSILGEEGNIEIQSQDGIILANITKDTEANENGEIVINYETEVKSITMTISKPNSTGILNIRNDKKIAENGFSRDDVKSLEKISENVETTYKKVDGKETKTKAEASITLKETESKASLSLESESLSTTAENQVLNLRAVLETNQDSKDLYKNPEVKITFPKQITDMEVSYKIVYANGLNVAENGAAISEENGSKVLTIKLEGEQTTYDGDAINGTIILVSANVKLDKLATTSDENVTLQFSNENATNYANNGTEKAPLKIVAESAMIYTNEAKNAGIVAYGSDQNANVALNVKSDEKKEQINMQVINNEGTTINGIKVIGKIPVVENNIERTNGVNVSKDATVYYSTAENPTAYINDANNGWTKDNMKNAKYFLVEIDSMENAEKVEINYDLKANKNLPYNIAEEANYTFTYTNSVTNKETQIKSSTLTFTTDATAVLERNFEASLAGEKLNDGDEVKSGEVITYKTSITNKGREDASGISIVGTVPEGTTLLEVNKYFEYSNTSSEDEFNYSKEDWDYIHSIEDAGGTVSEEYYLPKEDKKFKNDNITIKAGETVNFVYKVRVNANVDENAKVSAETSIKYKDETSTEKIEHTLKNSDISAELTPWKRFEGEVVSSSEDDLYVLKVTNNTESELNDINVTLNKNSLLNVTEVYYDDMNAEELNIVEQDDNVAKFTVNKLAAKETASIGIKVNINEPNSELNELNISAVLNNSVKTNKIVEKVKQGEKIEVVSSTATTSKIGNAQVNTGDKIKYNINLTNLGEVDAESVSVNEEVSKYLDIESVKVDGKDYEYELYQNESEDTGLLNVNIPIKAKENAELEIIGKVKDDFSGENDEIIKISNKATISSVANDSVETETTEYYLDRNPTTRNIVKEDGSIEKQIIYRRENTQQNTNNQTDSQIDSNVESQENEENVVATAEQALNYEVSGIAWIDSNANGAKDAAEKTLEGINVYAIEVNSNNIVTNSDGTKLTTTTNGDGYYSLNLPEGEYLVVFEYDNQKYVVTSYKKDDIAESANSNVINSNIEVNGENKNVAITDSINLNTNVRNVNMGLVEARPFNLQIQKFVDKITVSNEEGTKEYVQKPETNLAKIEIGSKYLDGSNVSIEYKIRVTNTGEVAGYAKNIIDVLPSELNFSSSVNPDWYQSGENLNNISLTNTIINPGETKELELVLTKTMTSSNAGLVNNQASIESSYSPEGIDLNDSDDESSADVIIGIKTGGIVSYTVLTLTIIIIICGIAYLVNKKLLKDKIEI